jgi:hypothetical protein
MRSILQRFPESFAPRDFSRGGSSEPGTRADADADADGGCVPSSSDFFSSLGHTILSYCSYTLVIDMSDSDVQEVPNPEGSDAYVLKAEEEEDQKPDIRRAPISAYVAILVLNTRQNCKVLVYLDHHRTPSALILQASLLLLLSLLLCSIGLVCVYGVT